MHFMSSKELQSRFIAFVSGDINPVKVTILCTWYLDGLYHYRFERFNNATIACKLTTTLN